MLHGQTDIQERCADSYRIVGTSIGSMVEHNHTIILTLKANEDWSIGYMLKKLGRVGKDRPTGISLRRSLGFPNRENPRTLALP